MIVDCDWNPWVFVSSRTFSFDMLGSPNCMGNNIFVVPRDSLPMMLCCSRCYLMATVCRQQWARVPD